MTLSIGLAGLGVHGRRYARHLLQGDVPGARLAAISRRDVATGRAFATEHGLTFVDRPEELATLPGLDAVVLCLPPALHGPAAVACAVAGRPALVEKPLAATAAEARQVARAVERSGALLMPAHTLRFDTVVRRLHDAREALGALCLLAINQRFEPSDRPWIDTPGCGGMLLNTGIHEFDLVRFLSGQEPTSIQARTARVRTRDTEDQFVATIALDGGAQATVDASRASTSRSGRVELVGTDAQAWGDHIHRTLCHVRGRERQELGPVPPVNTLPLTLAAFVESVRAQQPPPIGVEDGVAAVAMVDAALASAARGEIVRLG